LDRCAFPSESYFRTVGFTIVDFRRAPFIFPIMDIEITIPLPACINENTPADIKEAITLFYRSLANKINFGIDGDMGNEAALREGFNEFIMMNSILKRPDRLQSDDPEHNVFYLEDKASELLEKLGV
jgi:hypothetical protein